MTQRILVIDDDPALQKMYRRIGKEIGHRVDTAGTGTEGFRYFREHAYDLVLLDLQLPDTDGIELLRKIREIDQRVGIYILTGFYGRFMDRLKHAAEDGLKFELFKKPLGVGRIRQILEAIMGNSGFSPMENR